MRERAGTREVGCRWYGNGADRRFSGWRVCWRDGPVEWYMRGLVERLADRVPALDVHSLGYDRRTTDLSEAVALLLYVKANPGEAPHLNRFVRKWAISKISFPESAGELWLSRGRALLAVEDEFYARVRDAGHGWELALGWLDTFAGVNPVEVASIAAAHERRYRYQVGRS